VIDLQVSDFVMIKRLIFHISLKIYNIFDKNLAVVVTAHAAILASVFAKYFIFVLRHWARQAVPLQINFVRIL